MSSGWLLTILLVVTLITGGLLTHFVIDKPPIIKSTPIDTVWMKPDTIRNTKTIRVNHIVAKIDTVKIVNDYIAVVYSDTVATQDSSKIWVKYYNSPINQFDISADIHEKVITKEKIITVQLQPPVETFWSRFGISIQTGIGMGWFKKNVDVYTGIGFHYKLN